MIWRDVKQESPEEKQRIIVQCKENVFEAIYVEGKYISLQHNLECIPVYWQPLPEPVVEKHFHLAYFGEIFKITYNCKQIIFDKFLEDIELKLSFKK